MDTYERVREQDLKQNAIVMAWFALAGRHHHRADPAPRRHAWAVAFDNSRGVWRGPTLPSPPACSSAGSRAWSASACSPRSSVRVSEAADAFNAAFRIPNLLQNLFGEGALSGSFIPVHAALRARGEHDAAAQTARTFFALLALAMSVLVLLGVLGAPVLVTVDRARVRRRRSAS